MAMNEPETKGDQKRAEIKLAVANFLKGGVIAIVTNPDQARVAENYGARGLIVMNYPQKIAIAKDQTPRGADPIRIRSIMSAVHLPIIGRVRYGHIAEARIMEACGVAAIDESDVIGHGDVKSMEKESFNVPVICFVANLTDALQRIREGASMLVSRVDIKLASKTGTNKEEEPNVKNASDVYLRIQDEIESISKYSPSKLGSHALKISVPLKFLQYVIEHRRLPVPFIAGGGVMHPMDVAMLMELGYEGVVASNHVFAAPNAEKRMRALVMATVHYKDSLRMAYIAENMGPINQPGTAF
ncbi:hypothetical protein H4R24_004225 [Coemansia sp. RSA 988]|nr:hypothetical protein H4R24_004225 [Coemansia sp. RSA 988]